MTPHAYDFALGQSHRRCKAYILNIHALNSDAHTLRIQYEFTQKQCVGVAIEGMDIWYMGLTSLCHWLDSDLIPRLLDILGKLKIFIAILLSDPYRRILSA